MMLPILILLPSLCPFVCPPFSMPLLSLHLIGLGIGLLDDVCMGLMRGDVLKLSCCLWFLLVPVCFSIASFSISSSKPLRPIILFCLVPSSHPLQHIPTHPAIWSNPFTISSLLSSSRRLLGCWFLTYLDFACDVSCPRLLLFLIPSPSRYPICLYGHCGWCLFCCGCWIDMGCCLFVYWTFISHILILIVFWIAGCDMRLIWRVCWPFLILPPSMPPFLISSYHLTGSWLILQTVRFLVDILAFGWLIHVPRHFVIFLVDIWAANIPLSPPIHQTAMLVLFYMDWLLYALKPISSALCVLLHCFFSSSSSHFESIL